MADQVTVYDAAGKPLRVWPIDAKALLASGEYWLSPPKAKAKTKAKARKPAELETIGRAKRAADDAEI